MDLIEKKIFRRQMLAKRDKIPFENRINADTARNDRIRSWKSYEAAELLLFYVSYRSEADTIQLIKESLSQGRDVAVPKVVGTEMVFFRITEFSQLVEGYRGILEPDTEKAVPITEVIERALLFVPGCAFDQKGGRMGYGGGFYDRFMEQCPDVKRVALAFEEQVVDEVPREEHDKSVDVIITEARILEVATGERKQEREG